jgi:protease-4
MNDKLGFTLSVINTNENGNFISLTEPMTPVQREAMQRMINAGYELFTSRCATGRGMELDSLKMIAEGRVWDGITAKKLGLVDEFGDLNNAIDWVVEKAKVGEYSVAVYPKEDTSFMSYLRGYVKMGVDKVMETKTGELYKYRDAVNDIINRDHIQCLMEPVVIK